MESTVKITILDDAASVMREALDKTPDMTIHLSIDENYNHEFKLLPFDDNKVEVRSGDISIYLNANEVTRANGLQISMSENPVAKQFDLDNPNMDKGFKEITVSELNAIMGSDSEFLLFDVRTKEERKVALIEGSVILDENAVSKIGRLPKEARLIFYCHSGVRSAEAARYFSENGYSNVFNLSGGIDAWSQQIDSTVPRY